MVHWYPPKKKLSMEVFDTRPMCQAQQPILKKWGFEVLRAPGLRGATEKSRWQWKLHARQNEHGLGMKLSKL